MNIIAWNCWSICSQAFSNLIKDIDKEYHASLIFLLETNVNKDVPKKSMRRSGFDSMFAQETHGQSNGIWCFYKGCNWKVEVLKHDR